MKLKQEIIHVHMFGIENRPKWIRATKNSSSTTNYSGNNKHSSDYSSPVAIVIRSPRSSRSGSSQCPKHVKETKKLQPKSYHMVISNPWKNSSNLYSPANSATHKNSNKSS